MLHRSGPRSGFFVALAALTAIAFVGVPGLSVGGTPDSRAYRELVALDKTLTQTVAAATGAVVAVHAYEGSHLVGGGVGSGVIIDSRGLVLSCAHVTAGSKNIRIVTADGTTYGARALGADKTADVTLLQMLPIDGEELRLPMAPRRNFAAEPLVLGEWVVALGHPGGPNIDQLPASSLGRLTATGIKLPREIGTVVPGGLLQTDLPINSGSSGGPLLDARGRLLGLNNAVSLIDDRAFALPFTALLPIFSSWIPVADASDLGSQSRLLPVASRAPVIGGFLGVQLAELGADELRELELQSGLRVTSIAQGGGAERGGMRTGDVLVSVDGHRVTSAELAGQLIREASPGSQLLAMVQRASRFKLLTIPVGGGHE